MKKTIRIKFINGIDFKTGIRDILSCVSDHYNFVETDDPDFIIFAPYGSYSPDCKAVRIGYFCENIVPDLSICDWAFGIPYEDEIKHPRYQRIQWHGFNPNTLVKSDLDIEKIIAQKRKFCNFIYSNSVPFREQFFRELSKYKLIDSPGRSMNNHPSLDTHSSQDQWQRKRAFLSEYKFTIAFENDSYPGYQTEKLLDPMLVNSLPIYWGNPHVDRHFNPKSFINGHDWIKTNHSPVVDALQKSCQLTLRDLQVRTLNQIGDRARRKLKSIGRSLKVKLQYGSFDDLIERIIEIDRDDSLYAKYLSEPWFYNNTTPSQESIIERWREIFG